MFIFNCFCRSIALVCLPAFLPKVCVAQDSRIWSSADGKFSVEATLERHDGSVLTLKKKSDGKLVTVPLSKLSFADRQFLALMKESTAGSAAASSEKRIRERLEARSLRASSSQIVLTTESKFIQSFKSANNARAKLSEVQNHLKKLREQQVELRKLERQGSVALAQINSQLASLPDRHPSYNQLVASNNATFAKLKLVGSQLEEIDLQIETQRKEFSVQQGDFMTSLFEARSQSQEILQSYAEIAKDKEVQQLIKELESATGKEAKLTASRTFQQNVKKLAKLESLVLTETIPLRKEGETYFVPVALGNGTEELVVDSGATSLCLPSSLASKLGIKPGTDDPEIRMTIADGSTIGGRMVVLPIVRVGRFVAENVECAVLNPEAVNAPALLGMSFLGRFRFELVGNESKLTITEINGNDESHESR